MCVAWDVYMTVRICIIPMLLRTSLRETCTVAGTGYRTKTVTHGSGKNLHLLRNIESWSWLSHGNKIKWRLSSFCLNNCRLSC